MTALSPTFAAMPQGWVGRCVSTGATAHCVSKSGCAPHEASTLARAIAALPRLRLRGLMAIPEPTEDEAMQRAAVARLREIYEQLRAGGLLLDTLSVGMSADLEAAVVEGSTMVRVGTALFGGRTRPG